MIEDKTCSNCNYYLNHSCTCQGGVRSGRAVDRNYCCSKWEGELWEGPYEFYWVRHYLTETIWKHSDLICELMHDRVLAFLFEDQTYLLREECDNYFSHQLTKDECLELSELFKEMAEDYE